jgi:hypothetical protein
MFSVTQNAGAITTAFGVNIGTIQGTSKWSLYSSDSTAPSYFAGNVGIGVTAPSAKLEVGGTTKLGTAGVAFSSMGACSLGSFTVSAGTNGKPCAGLPAIAAATCTPSANQGTTYSVHIPSAGTIVITAAANGALATWTCMWMVP